MLLGRSWCSCSSVGMGRPPVVHPNDPGVGAWLDANREALDLFLDGCARPDALWKPQNVPAGLFDR